MDKRRLIDVAPRQMAAAGEVVELVAEEPVDRGRRDQEDENRPRNNQARHPTHGRHILWRGGRPEACALLVHEVQACDRKSR